MHQIDSGLFVLAFEIKPEVVMSETIRSEMISRRRAFSLLGLAAASSLAVPATMLTATDADAQTGGMERRDERRTGREERRTERRSKKKKKKATTTEEKK
jgi:hypothetical protein